MGQLRLRDVFLKEMEVRGLDPKTIKIYMESATEFFKHFGLPPGKLKLDDLKDYQLHLIKNRNLAPNSVNRNMSGVRFFYVHVLNRHWYSVALPRVKVPEKIPTILSEQEVGNLIEGVHSIFYKALIMLLYSAGLRHSELINLKKDDIDTERMVIKIRSGKGGRDTQAILSEVALKTLRTYWRVCRLENQKKSDYLFFAQKGSKSGENKKLSHTALGYVLRVAQKAAGIKKKSLPTCCVIRLPSIYSKEALI